MSEFIERAVDFEPLPEEERSASGGDGKTLEGYAAVFDQCGLPQPGRTLRLMMTLR